MGLRGYWKLDGSATDSMGATVLMPSPSGTPAYVAGKLGSGFFPGQYVTFMNCPSCVVLSSPSTSAIDVGGGDFTVSVWTNHAANSAVDGMWWSYAVIDTGQLVIDVGGTGAAPTPVYATLHLFDTGAEVGAVRDTTVDFRAASNVDVWHHIVAYRRGTTIGVVVDGVETTASFTAAIGAPTTFFVGCASTGYHWQGSLDELGIWNRALSAAEIAALYNGGAAVALP
jgi:hypothetical protein